MLAVVFYPDHIIFSQAAFARSKGSLMHRRDVPFPRGMTFTVHTPAVRLRGHWVMRIIPTDGRSTRRVWMVSRRTPVISMQSEKIRNPAFDAQNVVASARQSSSPAAVTHRVWMAVEENGDIRRRIDARGRTARQAAHLPPAYTIGEQRGRTAQAAVP